MEKSKYGPATSWQSVAINGFEGLIPGEFDFAPTVVLRFERNRLIDVSAEFQSHFDEQIAAVRSELSAQDLRDFQGTDGKLAAASSLAQDRIHGLRVTKIKVLEIVWAYLYSGRAQEAWRALADMWPPGDLDRIRTAILNARARGIRSQIDDVSARESKFHFKKCAYIFDAVTERPQGSGWRSSRLVDTRPQAILLRRPPPVGAKAPLARSEQMIELVIDAAGKVWSADAVGDTDKDLAYAAKWMEVHSCVYKWSGSRQPPPYGRVARPVRTSAVEIVPQFRLFTVHDLPRYARGSGLRARKSWIHRDACCPSRDCL